MAYISLDPPRTLSYRTAGWFIALHRSRSRVGWMNLRHRLRRSRTRVCLPAHSGGSQRPCHLDFAPGLLLEPRDAGGGVMGDQGGIVPLRFAKRSPIISSQYFTDHPPCSNPPSQSSSGPPGACITPSSVRNVPTTSFLMVSTSGLPTVSTGRTCPLSYSSNKGGLKSTPVGFQFQSATISEKTDAQNVDWIRVLGVYIGSGGRI